MAVGLVRSIIGWVLALLLLLMFPWLLLPALMYWIWRRGFLGRALRWVLKKGGGISMQRLTSRLDSKVSAGMVSYEERVCYEAPCEDSPFIVVRGKGGRRMLMAAALRDRAGTRSDYGRVVVEVMAKAGGLTWTLVFAFFLRREGDLGGLILLERPAPAEASDPSAIETETMAQLDAVGQAVCSVAPSLSVRILRGRELASLALLGVPD